MVAVKTQPATLLTLPREIIFMILERLPISELLALGGVCPEWEHLVRHPSLWRKMVLSRAMWFLIPGGFQRGHPMFDLIRVHLRDLTLGVALYDSHWEAFPTGQLERLALIDSIVPPRSLNTQFAGLRELHLDYRPLYHSQSLEVLEHTGLRKLVWRQCINLQVQHNLLFRKLECPALESLEYRFRVLEARFATNQDTAIFPDLSTGVSALRHLKIVHEYEDGTKLENFPSGILPQDARLESLHLEQLALVDKALPLWDRLVRAATEIDLTGCRLPPHGLARLMSVARSVQRVTLVGVHSTSCLRWSPTIRELKVSKSAIGPTSLSAALASCPQLETFVARDCESLAGVDFSNPSLRVLDLAGSRLYWKHGRTRAAECPVLEDLCLQGCPEMDTVSIRAPRLQRLDASSTGLGTAGFRAAAAPGLPSLRELDLSRTAVCDGVFATLGRYCPNLVVVRVRENSRMFRPEIRLQELRVLCLDETDFKGAVVDAPMLRSLSLRGCTKLVDASGALLGAGAPALRSLNVSRTPVTNAWVKGLLRARGASSEMCTVFASECEGLTRRYAMDATRKSQARIRWLFKTRGQRVLPMEML